MKDRRLKQLVMIGIGALLAGFTRQAGNCLASAATRNGVTLYLILLKSKSYASLCSTMDSK